MRSLPVRDSAQFPRIWLRNLHEGARRAVLVVPDRNSADGHHVGGPLPTLELALRRKAHALAVRFAPRDESLLKVLALVGETLSVLNAEAPLRTKARTPSMRWFEIKRCSADFARFFHALILTDLGLITVLSHRYFLDGAAYCHAAAREVAMPDLFALERESA